MAIKKNLQFGDSHAMTASDIPPRVVKMLSTNMMSGLCSFVTVSIAEIFKSYLNKFENLFKRKKMWPVPIFLWHK